MDRDFGKNTKCKFKSCSLSRHPNFNASEVSHDIPERSIYKHRLANLSEKYDCLEDTFTYLFMIASPAI